MGQQTTIDLPEQDWHLVRALALDAVGDAMRAGRATAQFHGIVISAVRPSPRSRFVWLSLRQGEHQYATMLSPYGGDHQRAAGSGATNTRPA